jgi:hypothetical protein
MNELLLLIVGNKNLHECTSVYLNRTMKVWYKILTAENKRSYIKLRNKLVYFLANRSYC